jgi:hypothetical protein
MTIEVLIETGTSRVFVVAVDWPGWARSGKTIDDAIASFVEHGPRYKSAVKKRLALPRSADDLDVVQRVQGGSGTDFGVPSEVRSDRDAIDGKELRRLTDILEASWAAFDAAAKQAKGRTLAKGPRGGGRTLAKIVEHQAEAERAYLNKLGGSAPKDADVAAVRVAFLDALEARHRGDLPETGPRGGARFTAAEAVRRSAWHALDHAWEIEDRTD